MKSSIYGFNLDEIARDIEELTEIPFSKLPTVKEDNRWNRFQVYRAEFGTLQAAWKAGTENTIFEYDINKKLGGELEAEYFTDAHTVLTKPKFMKNTPPFTYRLITHECTHAHTYSNTGFTTEKLTVSKSTTLEEQTKDFRKSLILRLITEGTAELISFALTEKKYGQKITLSLPQAAFSEDTDRLIVPKVLAEWNAQVTMALKGYGARQTFDDYCKAMAGAYNAVDLSYHAGRVYAQRMADKIGIAFTYRKMLTEIPKTPEEVLKIAEKYAPNNLTSQRSFTSVEKE